MSNIETLLEKIEADSKKEQQSIIDAAKQKAEEIVSETRTKSEEEANIVLKKADEEAKNLLEKAQSRAKLESRDKILKAKQEVLEKVLDIVLVKLNNINKEDYLHYIKRELSKVNLSENATLQVLVNYKDYISENIEGIKVSQDTVESGFAVEDGNVVYNNDFENVIENDRNEIEEIVFRELFSSNTK